MSQTPIAEIVTFRLVEGSNTDAFTKAAEAMMPFLRSTGAMTGRILSCDPDGTWTDHITWTSLEAATSAAKEMFERPEAAPVMQMIDPEGMSMRHAPILFQTQME
ncbi:MAG: hypothetical protein ACSHXB_00560 [Sulfitobacter sp.]